MGIGYVWLDARIQATGSISTPIGNVSATLDQSASTGSITGAVGGYTNGWILKRLNAHADFLYFKLSTNGDDATVTDWRLGAYYYFSRNIGLGIQYKYNKLSYDRALLSRKLGGEVTYKGPQILASFRF